ncbi:hypothetical protein B0H13DRAFT_1459783, partial [Mycena leptocephala]
LAVYSPNNPAENAKFLETLQEKMNHLPRPDFVLGDFNMVEEALARLPHHKDALSVSDAMVKFQIYLGLCDGWRQAYPDSL